jgi:hypothetical protein
VIPLLEAWGEEVSPSRRTPTVGDWVQAQWDHLRRRKAELPDPDVLVEELRESYLALDADARFDFELWLDGALETEEAYREPDPLLVEQRFWEAWINSHFAGGDLDSSKCHDTRGCLEIWLEPGEYLLRRPDFSLAAAAVEVPGADVVTAGLTRIMREADQADRGSWRRRVRILDFAVPKRVCFGSFSDWSAEQQLVDGTVGFLEDLAEATGHELPPPRKPPCGWLGPDNETLVAPEDSEIRELFTDRTWRSAGGGASFGVHGWS